MPQPEPGSAGTAGPATAADTEVVAEIAPGERDPSARTRHLEEGNRFFAREWKSMRFAFIDAAKAEFPVHRLCGVLRVSRGGYFAWNGRPACRRQRDEPGAAGACPIGICLVERHLW
jgi:hypothetical protein